MGKACFVGVRLFDLRAAVVVDDQDKALDSFEKKWLFVYGPFGSLVEAAHWRNLYNLPDGEVVESG